MEDIKKGLKELIEVAPQRREQSVNRPDTLELSGTGPPTKEYTWRDP